jgi:hypothetical protein
MNKLRRYELLLDGKTVGKIKNDEIMELDISEGKHALKGRIDWCTSNEFDFDVSEGEIKYLKIGGFKHSRWLMPTLSVIMLLGILVLQPIFRRMHAKFLDNLFFGFIIICGLFLLYLFTFGRKRYLWIRNDLK